MRALLHTFGFIAAHLDWACLTWVHVPPSFSRSCRAPDEVAKLPRWGALLFALSPRENSFPPWYYYDTQTNPPWQSTLFRVKKTREGTAESIKSWHYGWSRWEPLQRPAGTDGCSTWSAETARGKGFLRNTMTVLKQAQPPQKEVVCPSASAMFGVSAFKLDSHEQALTRKSGTLRSKLEILRSWKMKDRSWRYVRSAAQETCAAGTTTGTGLFDSNSKTGTVELLFLKKKKKLLLLF